jgi:hypothetical protein
VNIAKNIRRRCFSRFLISFGNNEFKIEERLFNKRINVKKGKIDDIQGVFQSVQAVNIESQGKEMVTIQTQMKRFSFGIGLTATECLWIAQEINEWLELSKN